MTKNNRARKAAKRKSKIKAKKAITRATTSTARMYQMRKAASWEVCECKISASWDNQTDLTQMLVAKVSPSGQVAAASFLLDLPCLGLKNTLSQLFPSLDVFKVSEYRRTLLETQPFVDCDFDLAAKIVQEGIEYAANLGFKPNKDYKFTAATFSNADPQNCTTPVPVGGKDGQPFFFAGPYDNVNAIMRQLNRSVGEGNYHYMLPTDNPYMRIDGFDEQESGTEEDEYLITNMFEGE